MVAPVDLQTKKPVIESALRQSPELVDTSRTLGYAFFS